MGQCYVMAMLEKVPALHQTLRLYLGFLLLGVVCLGVSVLTLPLLLLPRGLRQRCGRQLIAWTFRCYLGLLELLGVCRFDLTALDALRDAPAMLIAPNHPSLLDAVMILSRLPGSACIMKAGIARNPGFGMGARLAGYIRSTPLRQMLHHSAAELRQGHHVLLFPEGTRSPGLTLGALQGTTGLIAKHAAVPVQTVLIETNSAFLGKGWPLLRTPTLPVTYRVRLGQRFAPPRHNAHAAQLVSELEHYFRAELAHMASPHLSPGSTAPSPP